MPSRASPLSQNHWSDVVNIIYLLGCTALAAPTALAQTTDIRFAAPTRIESGEKFLGEGRLYPSPVLVDINGDGHPDMVVGDLFGRVTVALGDAQKPMTFGAEEKLKDGNGEALDFSNW